MVRLLRALFFFFGLRIESFNPTMVRLLLPNSPCSATNDQLSIPQWCDCCIGYGLWLWAMVLLSIPQWCDCCHLSNSPFVLNPKLSIPQWCDCCALMPTLWHQEHFAFNPTMVRLLRDALFALEHVSRLFQSHNGAIAAWQKRSEDEKEEILSIPQWCDCCLPNFQRPNPTRSATFNPTMVRLLRCHRPNQPLLLPSFQSHNGAIAAPRVIFRAVVQVSFNPTMVRLLPRQNFGV